MIKTQEVLIPIGDINLDGRLVVPENALGVVLFSHGSGSSRFSPRNNYVAEELQKNGIATLLFDLLTKYEDAIYENRFNIDLLTDRLLKVTDWLKEQPHINHLPFGYFGASTGAASALKASAMLGDQVAAVVSRGGRPDLAFAILDQVVSPTLLIVGGLDTKVKDLNYQAYQQLTGLKDLKVVERATHLFEQPGKLEEVAIQATQWFRKYLSIHKNTDIRHAEEH